MKFYFLTTREHSLLLCLRWCDEDNFGVRNTCHARQRACENKPFNKNAVHPVETRPRVRCCGWTTDTKWLLLPQKNTSQIFPFQMFQNEIIADSMRFIVPTICKSRDTGWAITLTGFCRYPVWICIKINCKIEMIISSIKM